jgi:hypothetical protein
MRSRKFSLGLSAAFVALTVFGAAANAAAQQARAPHSLAGSSMYVTFDPPGSIYTWVTGINDSGQVVGFWRDSSEVVHSFLRNSDGSFVEFDPPGATFSEAFAIDSSGGITGYWAASGSSVYQGYSRDAAGNITTFEGSGAGYDATVPCCIDNAGSITGRSGGGGFVRAPSGTVTLFAPPDSALSIPESINQSGFISGTYYDSRSVLHGFILGPSRKYTILNVPGGGTGMGQGTNGVFLNDSGTATGAYVDSSSLIHGYLRSTTGVYTTFDAPGSKLATTLPDAINDAGEIVGIEQNISGLQKGFIRDNSGAITVFQAPWAGVAEEFNQGTAPYAINASGTVAGQYYDSNKVGHGFLRY